MLKKVLLIILALIILALGSLAIWQRDLIYAYFLSTKMTKEEIKDKIGDGKKIIEEATGVEIRDFTEEEQEQIKEGKTTENEVIGKILNESVNKNSEKEIDPVTETQNRHLSQIYALQAEYVGKLEAFASNAKKEYSSLSKELGTSEAKRKLLSKYLSQINSLEKECDARFESIVSSLETELKSLSASTEIIASIKKAYKDEKNLKRAYYMKEL